MTRIKRFLLETLVTMGVLAVPAAAQRQYIPFPTNTPYTLNITNHDSVPTNLNICHMAPAANNTWTQTCKTELIESENSLHIPNLPTYIGKSAAGVIMFTQEAAPATPSQTIQAVAGQNVTVIGMFNPLGAKVIAGQMDLKLPPAVKLNSVAPGTALVNGNKTIAYAANGSNFDGRMLFYGFNSTQLATNTLAIWNLTVLPGAPTGTVKIGLNNLMGVNTTANGIPMTAGNMYLQVPNITITGQNTTTPLANIEIRASTPGTSGATIDAMLTADLMNPGTNARSRLYGPDPSLETATITAFATDKPASYQVALFDTNGTQLGTSKTISLTPYQTVASSYFTLFGVTPTANTTVKATMVTGENAGIYEQISGLGGGSAIVPQQRIDKAKNTIFLPYMTSNTPTVSDVTLVNEGTVNAPISFTYQAIGGSQIINGDTILAKSSKLYKTMQQWLGRTGERAGMKADSPNATVNGITRYMSPDRRTFGAIMPGMTIDDAATFSSTGTSYASSVNGITPALSTAGVMNMSNIPIEGTLSYYDDAGNKVRTETVKLGAFASYAGPVPGVATQYARAMLLLNTDGGKALLYTVTTDASLRPTAVKAGYPVRIIK